MCQVLRKECLVIMKQLDVCQMTANQNLYEIVHLQEAAPSTLGGMHSSQSAKIRHQLTTAAHTQHHDVVVR